MPVAWQQPARALRPFPHALVTTDRVDRALALQRDPVAAPQNEGDDRQQRKTEKPLAHELNPIRSSAGFSHARSMGARGCAPQTFTRRSQESHRPRPPSEKHHNGSRSAARRTTTTCAAWRRSATIGPQSPSPEITVPTPPRRPMVERKTRPTPLTLVARKSAKPAGKPGPTTRLQLPSKLFVLDTNVLMHDPTSLFRFEEHDIYLPILTLEELDNNKKGVTEVARNARQASRFLDDLVTHMPDTISAGIPLDDKSGNAATGRLFLQTEAITAVLPASLANGKTDNQILAVVMHLMNAHTDRHVVLVSKDINMRIKARALGIAAEDYFNDKVLEDTELLFSGMRELPADFWDRHGKG